MRKCVGRNCLISTLETAQEKVFKWCPREDTRAALRHTEGIQRPSAKLGSDRSKGFLYHLLEALELRSEITPTSSD